MSWNGRGYNLVHADDCTTRTAERPRPVPLRNARENCCVRERYQPARRRRSQHAGASAVANRLRLGAGLQRLVRYFHQRSLRRAARAFLFCGVGHHTGIRRPARLFYGRFEKHVRPAWQSNALLARLFAVSQYIGSLPSAPVSFGAPPTAVPGGGAIGPTPLPSSGSGVFPNGVPRGGNGFGVHPGSRIVRQSVL